MHSGVGQHREGKLRAVRSSEFYEGEHGNLEGGSSQMKYLAGIMRMKNIEYLRLY